MQSETTEIRYAIENEVDSTDTANSRCEEVRDEDTEVESDRRVSLDHYDERDAGAEENGPIVAREEAEYQKIRFGKLRRYETLFELYAVDCGGR